MSARQLDLAREFCEKVGAIDLLDYLGLESTADATEARAALKARRRKMQGQQSNPKFKDEARRLIRQFQTLDSVLSDPAVHVKDMAARRESAHLPILEMTIKGVLAGGPLTGDQESYLRNNAKELGVSEQTFDALLQRLQKDGTLSPAQARVSTPSSSPPPLQPVHSRLDPTADKDTRPLPSPASNAKSGSRSSQRGKEPATQIRRPEPSRPGFARTPIVPPPRSSGTGVPPGPRDADPLGGVTTSAATAPPIRSRGSGNRGASGTDPSTVRRRVEPKAGKTTPTATGMEIVGQAHRDIEILGRRPAQLTIRVRLLGELPVAARVVPDDPWVTVVPQRLSPTQREHLVRVTVHPDRMFEDKDETTVRLFNDLGEQVEIAISARRKTNWSSLGMGIAILVGAAALVVAVFLILQVLFSQSAAGSLTIKIDPSSEFVLLDGDKIGSGPLVRLDEPPMGPHRITIVQEGFATYENTITLERDEDRVINVELDLTDPMDFEPHPDDEAGTVANDEGLRDDLQSRMSACLSKTPKSTSPYQGQLEITLKKDGHAGRVELVGTNPVPSNVKQCLRRQGATVNYPALDQGSYAKLLIDFYYPVPSTP